MNDLMESEQTPLDGGGIRLPDASTREEGEISEDEDDIDADFIRNATTVITTDLDRLPPHDTPNRLTFNLPEARIGIEPEEHARPRATRPLDGYEQFSNAEEPPATSNLGNEVGQAAANLLRNSLGLTAVPCMAPLNRLWGFTKHG